LVNRVVDHVLVPEITLNIFLGDSFLKIIENIAAFVFVDHVFNLMFLLVNLCKVKLFSLKLLLILSLNLNSLFLVQLFFLEIIIFYNLSDVLGVSGILFLSFETNFDDHQEAGAKISVQNSFEVVTVLQLQV
jgi:hypothetical protein